MSLLMTCELPIWLFLVVHFDKGELDTKAHLCGIFKHGIHPYCQSVPIQLMDKSLWLYFQRSLCSFQVHIVGYTCYNACAYGGSHQYFPAPIYCFDLRFLSMRSAMIL
jgi:hypothetical protein